MFEQREGEIRLDVDPATLAGDARVTFIGTIHSPWKTRAECPKNLRQARERNKTATVEVAPAYRAGLEGLEPGATIILLSWLGHAPRDLIVQKPRHAETPSGTFALRSPARPNPVGLHVVRLLEMDAVAGKLTIDAIDVLDQTAIIDIKPWYATTDVL